MVCKPFWLAWLRSVKTSIVSASRVSADVWRSSGSLTSLSTTLASTTTRTPFVSRKRRSKSTMVSPFQCITRFGFSVTVATTTASIFSLLHSATKASTSSGRTTTAIRSWDSEMAISVPFKPWYFNGTLSRSISRPSANSPIATQTPPAPKSFDFLIRRVTSPLRKRRWILRSSMAFPFWTSAPAVSTDSTVWTLEEPVAPPTPSRPVLPPSKIITSPASGFSRTTFSLGAAPTTAPSSIRLATKPGWKYSRT